MLVLTRKLQEQIRIGDQITITILRVKGGAVRVGIEAPRQIRVVRGELPPRTESVSTSTPLGQRVEQISSSLGSHPAGPPASEMEEPASEDQGFELMATVCCPAFLGAAAATEVHAI